MLKKYVVGNWKMNGSMDLITKISSITGNDHVQIVICPPHTHLLSCKKVSKVYSIGAQNCFHEKSGAYTGEVSAEQLVDVGCEYVILGHSERRTMFGETDSVVNAKGLAAVSSGLTPIICVGEPQDIRESGNYKKYIYEQLINSLDGLDISKLIVAYEPIWAIGTGIIPNFEQILEVVDLIKDNFSNVAVLYGGSVKPGNILELQKNPKLDGFLIGGASLDPTQFQEIVDSFMIE